MIGRIIEYSARNRFLVLLLVFFATAAGVWSLRTSPLDAIPDLSDVQVIVFTDWPGRSPDIVEDQITYPIIATMIAAPRVKYVRGESMFGYSFVNVVFEDGTDLYWARSRVLEYMQGISGRLPEGVSPRLGPDARPHLLHVVDIEGGNAVIIFSGMIQQLPHGHQWHVKISSCFFSGVAVGVQPPVRSGLWRPVDDRLPTLVCCGDAGQW